jgi:predicted RNA-binding protein with TRAM domain
MEISEQLLCLFSGQIEQRDGSYVIEVPEQELELGDLEGGDTYRVALFSTPSTMTAATTPEPDHESGSEQERSPPEPPVEEGETRVVEIEDIGEQGDGITRVERGYVVIVPDTETGERVRIEITDVQENVAFAEVVERISYYE